MLRSRYLVFARYNQWANAHVYAAAAALSDTEYRADCGAFFKSIHGTLNHLLLADRLWMTRFRREPAPNYTLDTILFENLAELRQARETEDTSITTFADAQDETSLQAELNYRTIVNPMTITQPLASALDHFFNHQTHHRGQIHAILTRLTNIAPSLDLIYFQRETGLGGIKSVG